MNQTPTRKGGENNNPLNYKDMDITLSECLTLEYLLTQVHDKLNDETNELDMYETKPSLTLMLSQDEVENIQNILAKLKISK